MGPLREPIPPSTFLPPLNQLHLFSTGALSLVLQSLNQLYWLDRKTYSIQYPLLVDSGYASDDGNNDQNARSVASDTKIQELGENWQLARADPFERDFATRWMTAFLAKGLDWVAEADGESEMEYEDRESVYEGVATLLSACSQASESGALLREFDFPQACVPGGRSVKVVLKDEDLSSTDHTSVGLQTWGSSSIMAERLVHSPGFYGLPLHHVGRECPPLRILELGAGTGLLSLVIGSLLVQSDVSAQIVATDYHPDVLSNLEDNIEANPNSMYSAGGRTVEIVVAALDWELLHNTKDVGELRLGSCFDDKFDMIIAADVVYRADHANWLASVVRQFLRRPRAEAHMPSFHLIAPSRPTHESTHTSIHEAFSPVTPTDYSVVCDHSRGGCEELDLRIVAVTDVPRVKSVGRADESGYREYRVEWSRS